MGFRPPPRDGRHGGDGRFDVYLKELGSQGLYGYCAPEYRVPGLRQVASGYCVLDDDFARKQYGANPMVSLRVTAAHEFFHAIQFGYDFREDPWLLESTATWMEERVADGADDNRRYLPYGQVARPGSSLDLFDPSRLQPVRQLDVLGVPRRSLRQRRRPSRVAPGRRLRRRAGPLLRGRAAQVLARHGGLAAGVRGVRLARRPLPPTSSRKGPPGRPATTGPGRLGSADRRAQHQPADQPPRRAHHRRPAGREPPGPALAAADHRRRAAGEDRPGGAPAGVAAQRDGDAAVRSCSTPTASAGRGCASTPAGYAG